MNAKSFPAKEEIEKHYRSVLSQNDRQNVCLNPQFPRGQVESEIEAHSLSTLNPLSQIDITEGHTILDIGCGPGADCFLAARQTGRNGKVIGLDILGELIERARYLAQKYDYRNIQFMEYDCHRLPLPDGTIDVALMNYSFHLFMDKASIVQELHRVLRPNGKAVIGDSFSPKQIGFEENPDSWFCSAANAITYAELEALANQAGFLKCSFERVMLQGMPDDEVTGYAILMKDPQ